MFNSLFGQTKTKYSLDDFNKIKDKIYPIIKVQLSDNAKTDNEISFKDNNSPLFDKLAGDLLLFYGIDNNSSYELVMSSYFPKSITKDSLKNIAIHNLDKLIGDSIRLSGTDFGGNMLICGYNFEAALVLIDKLWITIREQLNYDFLIAVPSKDLIFIINKNDKTQLDKLKQVIDEIHKNGEFLLSKKIYEFSDSKLIEYKEK